jgi:hypothetical protein
LAKIGAKNPRRKVGTPTEAANVLVLVLPPKSLFYRSHFFRFPLLPQPSFINNNKQQTTNNKQQQRCDDLSFQSLNTVARWHFGTPTLWWWHAAKHT